MDGENDLIKEINLVQVTLWLLGSCDTFLGVLRYCGISEEHNKRTEHLICLSLWIYSVLAWKLFLKQEGRLVCVFLGFVWFCFVI